MMGTLRRAASPLALLWAAQAGPVSARVEIDPSIELRQVFDLPIDYDFVTYSEAAVGLDGSIETRRVRGQISYRFRQRIEEAGNLDDEQYHTLAARGDVDVVSGMLKVDAGAFATMLNSNLRRPVSFSADNVNDNLAQTYSAYVKPSFHQRLGRFAEVDASYRLGYVNVDETNRGGSGSGSGSSGGTMFGSYADSVNQSAEARLGNRENSSRFRWDLIGDFQDERVDRLDQHYRSYYGNAELEYALNRKFAVLGSVGYEDIRSTEDAILTNALGEPLVGPDGDFIIDPTAPPRVSYDEQGLTFDGGFRWTPSRRTFLLIRAGKRFGDFNLNGQLRYQASPRLSITASWSESVSTFGQLLTQDFNGVPVSFFIPGGNQVGFGGCILGVDPATGTCLFNWTQSITNATFKNQSGQFIVETQRGATRASLAAVYTARRYLDTQQLRAPGSPPIDPTLSGRSDKTISLIGRVSHQLRRDRELSGDLHFNRYDFALSRTSADYYIGASVYYRHNLTGHLEARVGGNVSQRFSELGRDWTNATIAASLAYRF